MPSPALITRSLLGLLMLLACAGAWGQGTIPPSLDPLPAGDGFRVSTQGPSEALHVAEETRIEITISHPAGITLNDPIVPDTGRIQVLDVARSSEIGSDGTVTETITAHVVLFHIGRFYFPPLRMLFKDAAGQLRYVESETLSLKVASMLPDGDRDSAQLRPPRGSESIVEADYRPLLWGGIALGVLLILGIGLLLGRRVKRRPKPVFVSPPRPAWIIARERLEALEPPGFDDRDAVRNHYFSLSEIIREYLGARFGFDSLELTTSELLDRLEKLGWPDGLSAPETEAFLLDCDLVKFARYLPAEGELRTSLETALGLVERSVPKAPEPTPDAPPPQEDRHVAS